MVVSEPDRDGLVTLTMVEGDTGDFVVSVKDDADPPVAVDLSKAVDGTVDRPAVIRFAVKTDPTDPNSAAQVYKTTYREDQIKILAQTGPTVGQCRVMLDKPDTEDADTSASYSWDVEVSRQDALRPGASVGTATVVAGSNAVVGVGTAFTKARKGDIFQPLGLNVTPCIVDKITDDTHMTVETWQAWFSETGLAFELRRGRHKTAARGPFVFQDGVVAK